MKYLAVVYVAFRASALICCMKKITPAFEMAGSPQFFVSNFGAVCGLEPDYGAGFICPIIRLGREWLEL